MASCEDMSEATVLSQPDGAQVKSDQEHRCLGPHWALGLGLQGTQTPQTLTSSQTSLPHSNSTHPNQREDRLEDRPRVMTLGAVTRPVVLSTSLTSSAMALPVCLSDLEISGGGQQRQFPWLPLCT